MRVVYLTNPTPIEHALYVLAHIPIAALGIFGTWVKSIAERNISS